MKPPAFPIRVAQSGTQSTGFHPRSSRARQEGGYVLLALLLIVSLMAIAFTYAIIIPMKFQVKRDREEEMIHRGVQYTRAIRLYYKKFGRYPTRIEDLENTNNLRYLRKRYKDPLNKNQDFRLLHFGEPGLALGGSIGGGVIPGATPAGGAANGLAGSSGFGNNSAFGNNSGFGNSNNSAFGNSGNSFGSGAGVNTSGVFAQSLGNTAANSNGGAGTNSNSAATPGQPGTNQSGTNQPGQDPSQPGSQTPGTTQGTSAFSGQPGAAGPIVGVASLSKQPTIRLFNKKTKYNEWQFLYDPTLDLGGLIKTPYQQSLQSFSVGQNPLGQPGQPGSTGTSSSFGSSSGFGNNSGSSGFGNNSGFGNSGPGAPPAQPPANPPQ